MATLDLYRPFGISTADEAFDKLVDSLQSLYGAEYYVDWAKVFRFIARYEREFALLGTLCGKDDVESEAARLIYDFPQLIPVLPGLIACRGSVTLTSSDVSERPAEYAFEVHTIPVSWETAQRYGKFIVRSGISTLLQQIKSVKDYMTGVEVGMDTNGRKNRGGACGVTAVAPIVERAVANMKGVSSAQEMGYAALAARGFTLPQSCRGLVWDFCCYTTAPSPRLVVMEVNHYGSSGSKPPAIAREYEARDAELASAGIGFVWVTDGIGWRKMLNPLRQAFGNMRCILSTRLAAEGLLEAALRRWLQPRDHVNP